MIELFLSPFIAPWPPPVPYVPMGPHGPPACSTPQGNPDGRFCMWTNPANGKQYVVDWTFWY